MNNGVKKMVALVGTAIFMAAWVYAAIMKHLEYGKLIAVCGFILTVFIVWQLKDERNRDKTYLGLFIGNVVMIMTLTSQLR